MLSSVETKPKPIFGGHEKFVFRHGWLKKGVDAVDADPRIFADDQALVTLGVGKNMVRSIRHWCLATNLIEELREQPRSLRVSELGRSLLVDGAWDPFMEDSGTLWLTHWVLCSNESRALVWHLVFSKFYEQEFTKRQLVYFLGKQFDRMGITTTTATILREVDCFLRTYVATARNHQEAVTEETFDCPLVELDLIHFVAADNVYQVNTGPKASLPVEVFGYGLLDFLPLVASSRRTVAVDECLYHENSPGQVFRLDENSVIQYLEELADVTAGNIQLAETAGLRQVYFQDPVATGWGQLKLELLERYYGRR